MNNVDFRRWVGMVTAALEGKPNALAAFDEIVLLATKTCPGCKIRQYVLKAEEYRIERDRLICWHDNVCDCGHWEEHK